MTPLQEYSFTLPSIGEQRRLVAALESTSAAREAVESCVVLGLAALRAAYQVTFGSLNELANTSSGARLDELCEIRRGASPRPIRDQRWFAVDGPGWVRIRDLPKNSRFLTSTEQRLSSEGAARSVRVHAGEIILSIAATIGRPIIVDMEACIHDGFVVLRNLSPRLNRDFLYHYLRWIEPMLEGKGQLGTQKNVNASIVGDLRVAIPDTQEQAEAVDLFDRLLAATDMAVARVEALRSFNGTILAQEVAT